MTYTTEDVRSAALAVLGDMPENLALFDILCDAALSELMRKLIRPMNTEEEKRLLLQAAGMLAAAKCRQLEAHGDISSFKAGQVQIQRGQGRSEALALKDSAYGLLAGYIGGEDFAFTGVRG